MRPPVLSRKFFATNGTRGGKRRAKVLTAARRSEIARAAATARWAKEKARG